MCDPRPAQTFYNHRGKVELRLVDFTSQDAKEIEDVQKALAEKRVEKETIEASFKMWMNILEPVEILLLLLAIGFFLFDGRIGFVLLLCVVACAVLEDELYRRINCQPLIMLKKKNKEIHELNNQINVILARYGVEPGERWKTFNEYEEAQS